MKLNEFLGDCMTFSSSSFYDNDLVAARYWKCSEIEWCAWNCKFNPLLLDKAIEFKYDSMNRKDPTQAKWEMDLRRIG